MINCGKYSDLFWCRNTVKNHVLGDLMHLLNFIQSLFAMKRFLCKFENSKITPYEIFHNLSNCGTRSVYFRK
jgi:hypothetical protein